MGRGSTAETGGFSRRPHIPAAPQNRLLLLYPDPQRQEFVLPPPRIQGWAVYLEDYPGKFFPVCTWGDCVNQGFMTPDGKLQGKFLLSSSVEHQEDAVSVLLYHFEHSHNLKNVVDPYEPHGFILVKQTQRVRPQK